MNYFLIEHITTLYNIINILYKLLTHQFLFYPKLPEPVNNNYRKFEVDEPPIFYNHKIYDYKDLLEKLKEEKGKELKPIKLKNQNIVALYLK